MKSALILALMLLASPALADVICPDGVAPSDCELLPGITIDPGIVQDPAAPRHCMSEASELFLACTAAVASDDDQRFLMCAAERSQYLEDCPEMATYEWWNTLQ